MKDKEILIKAIEKAERNGYNGKFFLNRKDILSDQMIWGQFLFNHDFAKAFWGEGIYVDTDEGKEMWIKQDNQMTQLNLEDWQYHLQQIVLEEDPISYLQQFLD